MEIFFDCPIEELIFEDGIKQIGSYASFWGATVTEIVIPSSVEQIEDFRSRAQQAYDKLTSELGETYEILNLINLSLGLKD